MRKVLERDAIGPGPLSCVRWAMLCFEAPDRLRAAPLAGPRLARSGCVRHGLNSRHNTGTLPLSYPFPHSHHFWTETDISWPARRLAAGLGRHRSGARVGGPLGWSAAPVAASTFPANGAQRPSTVARRARERWGEAKGVVDSTEGAGR